jgi:hypothetical protein
MAEPEHIEKILERVIDALASIDERTVKIERQLGRMNGRLARICQSLGTPFDEDDERNGEGATEDAHTGTG